MKTMYRLVVMTMVALTLLALSMPVQASKMETASNHPLKIRMYLRPTCRLMILKSSPRMALLP